MRRTGIRQLFLTNKGPVEVKGQQVKGTELALAELARSDPSKVQQSHALTRALCSTQALAAPPALG